MTRRKGWPKPSQLNELPTPVSRRPAALALARLLTKVTVRVLPTDDRDERAVRGLGAS